MRIVHTSDWHAGRVWKGIDRLPELEAVLGSLADHVERERVDLVLVTGDLFDTGAPSAKAERVVFRFFKRLGAAGAQSVVIAGNHDSAARLEAWGELAQLVGVHVVGRPASADNGGVIELRTAAGEVAVVAALPFAAPRMLVTALELAADDTTAMQTYADKMRAIVTHLTSRFRGDAVNVLCAHTHLDNASYSGSERKVHLGDDWAATAQGFPSNAHYVALGHIHKPQHVPAPSPTYYAGSPLQLDFGERGEPKTFVSVEAVPGRPAQIRHVPYVGGTPLEQVEGTFAELEQRAEALHAAGWLKVVVRLLAPDPDVNRKVRQLLANAVSVDVTLPERDVVVAGPPPATDGSPVDLYRAYHLETYGRPPATEVVERLTQLLAEREGNA
jgi:exonuclease SbcD